MWVENIDDSAGAYIPFEHKGQNFWSNHITVTNQGGETVRIYFDEDDFTADAALDAEPKKYVPLVAAGQYEGPDELNGIWVRAEAATTDVHVIARERSTMAG